MACAAVIVASGTSRRMGFDKLAAPLGGIPVLRRAVLRIMEVPEITRVVVVCPPDRFDALLAGAFTKSLIRVDGGAERQDSVQSGLAALSPDEDLVAIHDGARPLVDPAAVSQCIAAASQHGAASLARPVTETVKFADENGFAVSGIDRSRLWLMETPQVFRTELLRQAYAKVSGAGISVTDEVSAMETIKVPSRLILSSGPNPKITYASDLEAAEALLA